MSNLFGEKEVKARGRPAAPAKRSAHSADQREEALASCDAGELDDGDARSSLSASADRPLAERMRPGTLGEVAGQAQVVARLKKALAAGKLPSAIFWGPPGTGKTTLARIVARESGAHFVQLAATSSGVKDVRAAIEEAAQRRTFDGAATVLFIDEIHRFNKGQQDALLQAVENGTITLLGATTENPSFEVNGALLSRCQVIVLSTLDETELAGLLERALTDPERGYGGQGVTLDEDAYALLLRYAQGDARWLLGGLETAVNHARGQAAQCGVSDLHETPAGGMNAAPTHLTVEAVTQALGRKALLYDKSGEEHYNLASALIKSMRGSDPDAAIYYTVRMLEGGEGPEFVARRMAIFASEDVGNADPQALALAAAAVQVVTFIGMPESFYTLTQLAAYLALAPKSDGGKRALARAKELVREHGPLPTPLDIRNAPTGLMKELGYGKGYASAHAEADGIGAASTMPEALRGERLYFPVPRGFEAELGKRLAAILAKRGNENTAETRREPRDIHGPDLKPSDKHR